ncbi:MAG TPA: ECF-type sigma factor [Verrucomicrobiae bacterium]|nr:ECF-type sigma factor [Verrucomicrobiae bacterium]
MDASGTQITELLHRVRAGDEGASNDLMPLVYAELHGMAERHLRKERASHTLQPTALVNEAYLRIFQGAPPEFADRVHFLALASRVMRHILVDYARRRVTRAGGDAVQLDTRRLGVLRADMPIAELDLLDLDRAIEALAQENPDVAAAMEMRYFGGMTAEETAEAVGRTIHVVQHDLRFGHAWLRRRLARAGATRR